MPVRLSGYLSVDVEDYQDDIEIHADIEDLHDLMMENNITSEEMIAYLRDGESGADQGSVIAYIDEEAEHDDLFAIQAAVFARLRNDYEAVRDHRDNLRSEVNRIQNEMAVDRAKVQETKTAAIGCIEVLKSNIPHDVPLMNEVRRLDSMFN